MRGARLEKGEVCGEARTIASSFWLLGDGPTLLALYLGPKGQGHALVENSELTAEKLSSSAEVAL
jgi:hypothetical protein